MLPAAFLPTPCDGWSAQRTLQVSVYVRRRLLAVAHCQDDRGRAADDVAPGEDAVHRCLEVVVDLDVAPLVDLQVGRRRGEQRVRLRADGDDDHVAREDELRTRDLDGAAPARGIGLAQLHADAFESRNPALLVADDFGRGGQELETDALLLGVMDFLEASRQLVARSTVDADRVGRAQPAGGPDGVHGNVAAAHYRHALTAQDRRVGVRVVGAHEVHAGQVFVGRVDALEVLAGDVHEDRQARAYGHEDGVELLAQLRQGVRLADDLVGPDLDAVVDQPVHFLLDDVLGQAELGDAVDQDATGRVEGFEDRDLVAALGQLAGRSESGRARTHDGDLVARQSRLSRREDVTVVDGPVGDKALEVADRDRRAGLGAQADLLALRLLRADASGDAGQGVVAEQRVRGGLDVALAQQPDEVGDVDRNRTAINAVGLGALKAAIGLHDGQLLGVAEVDLGEVASPGHRVLLGHVAAIDLHPQLLGERLAVLVGAAGQSVDDLGHAVRVDDVGHQWASPLAEAGLPASAKAIPVAPEWL